jgi:hypothetical protein
MKSGPKARPLTLREEQEPCTFNGIDGATGEYLMPPLTPRLLADVARREPRYFLPDLRKQGPAPGPRDKGPCEGVDARDLGQTGWGVIFASSVTAADREALAPLLTLRRMQASRIQETRYREIEYRRGESKSALLARHGAAPGPAEPDRLPYYLLLVGNPEEIPFEFQYQLDVQYAVGRLHFDTPDEYSRYARTVVDVEGGKVRRPAAATFFGPRHHGDLPTALSSDHLAAPLATEFAASLADWSIRAALAEKATKRDLEAILAADDSPALLFTAGHGLCFYPGDDRQRLLQGSLICQDWPGPGQPLEEGHFFGADDLEGSAQVAGMIAFHFSCFGAGTPRNDGFPEPLHGRRRIAPQAFLSRLSRRLLTHASGGAQAVVGHVDRAWSWSFTGLTGAKPSLRPVFANTLKRLANGYPIGFAMEYFNGCYAELASDLDDEIKRSPNGRDARIAELWTSRNDARNYAVLGDPAVRLAVAPREAIR